MAFRMGSILASELSWEDAIEVVLRSAEGAMHYADIAEQVSVRRLKKVGANPSSVVATILSQSLKDESTPFQRVGRGEYTLKETLKSEAVDIVADAANVEKADPETGALKAFGMFWQRSSVMWGGKPKLLGRQAPGASDVNFAEQVGVYLLHDRDRVIYVGRADSSLFSRLSAHTIDRLSGRWDRFSWFGLCGVREDGTLTAKMADWTHGVVISTLEALLIESLEPPLNRKRGDNFSGVEYLQVSDPEIEKTQKKQLLAQLQRSAGL